MLCLACRTPTTGALCRSCRAGLKDAPDRWVEPRLLVRSGLSHDGPARLLVHRLKYEGILRAADELAGYVPPFDAVALVPVPRTMVRRHRYGVDPGLELARVLGRRFGVPVLDVLRPAVWGRKHAGVGRDLRVAPSFRLVRPPPRGAVLVDDVVTTGVTLGMAAHVTGLTVAVTATSAIQ